MIVCATLKPFADYVGANITVAAFISLFVCLIPTTIGGLLSAIGIAGMSRLNEANVLAMSGRAIEAAGSIEAAGKTLNEILAVAALIGAAGTRRVRELGYMAKLYALEDLDQIHEPGAVILSGGPKSTTDADAPDIDFEWLQSLNVPVLGVCYGMQLLNIKHGGTVKASNKNTKN